MKRIIFKNDKFILYDGDEQEILLNSLELMSNKSRIPMQSQTGGDTIPKLIISLAEEHKKISSKTEEAEGIGSFAAYLMDILLVPYLFRTSVPLKVAEVGAENGVLSYHLASLMGRLNPESSLCCISNIIGNDSENQWLNRIVMVENPPVLSMLVADYEDTQLASDHFDIVVINGSVRIEKPYDTIREAERLVKKDGVIFCYSKESPLLESCFKLIFADRREYEVIPDEKILITQYDGSSWIREENHDLKEEATELIHALHQAVISADSKEKFRILLRKIDECASKAAESYDIKRKTELLRLKEPVMDYMLNAEDEFAELYKKRLLFMIGELEQY